MSCELLHRHVGAYVDGELDAATGVEFDRHLERCEDCALRVEFEAATRTHVREACASVRAPAHLATRVQTALRTEDHAHQGPRSRSWVLPIRWQLALPLSTAAAIAIFALAAYDANTRRTEALALDVVRLHSAALPADVRVRTAGFGEGSNAMNEREEAGAREADGAEIAQYFRGRVGFPVRPAQFDERSVRLVGARLSNVRERQAAALYYDVDGQRLTVVVTDAPVGQTGRSMRVEGRELFYSDVGGHAVPVREHQGLRYAFTGDVDRARLLQLAASAHVP